MAGLVVRGVSVHFGGLSALENVSFNVAPRSIVGVIGPNGAGKTTLFNVISGFVDPSAGSMVWENKPLRPTPARLVDAGIARTLQAVGLFPGLTALENVMVGAARRRRSGFGSALFGLPRGDRDERRLRADALEWLNRLGVADSADRVPTTLPYPVQKQIALARALVAARGCSCSTSRPWGLGAEDLPGLGELIRSLAADMSRRARCCWSNTMWTSSWTCVTTLSCWTSAARSWPEPRSKIEADHAVATAYLGSDVPAELDPTLSTDLDDTGVMGRSQ